MRVCILPSWCPNATTPHAGSFFIEQAHAFAAAYPDWQVIIVLHDLSRARFPLPRPWRWLRFFYDALMRKKLRFSIADSGLIMYEVFSPYLPYAKGFDAFEVNAKALAKHADIALQHIGQHFGSVELLHAQASYPAGAALKYMHNKGAARLFLSEHLGPFPPHTLRDKKGAPHKVIRDAYHSAQFHSAVSQVLADDIVAQGLVKKVVVIPNFLSDAVGEYDVPVTDKNIKNGAFHLLAVGGPSAEKGSDVLLEALALIEKNIVLTIVGNSAHKKHFELMASRLHISHKVRFAGAVSRAAMTDFYAACDAVVVASRYESFSVVCIEAFAHGKPVIATRSGGPQDSVNEYNGLLVKTSDVEALRKGIEQLIEQYNTYNPARIRTDFLTRFSASAVNPTIKTWYMTHLSQN